jgi:hypothetical protein
MNHWETHLYTFAVAMTQGDKIKPENLQGVRVKAIKHGHTEAECLAVEYNPQHYVTTGDLPILAGRTHMICEMCGSTDVRADAHSGWDAQAGMWVLHSTYDETYCEPCDSSTSLLEIDEASRIEIQAFGMINVADGSRIAETTETPDFFDVMVSVSPDKSGVIHTLEEYDDMTAPQAALVLAAMAQAYPFAPISRINCDLEVAH